MAMQQAINDSLIADLVMGCQRGETAAVERLYDLYADRLFRYLVLRVGDRDTAADLTTELFLRVLQHIGSFKLNRERPAATVSAWLYRIAANLAAEHHRTQRRRPWISLEDLGLRPIQEPGPDSLAERHEELGQLADAMSALSEEQRLVVIAKFVEAMSNSEIATWMGKTEGAIKSLQHRALRTLARTLRSQTQQPRQTWLSYARK
jgi:RNA polymerase sigma-70 factor (ECF subfamily)